MSLMPFLHRYRALCLAAGVAATAALAYGAALGLERGALESSWWSVFGRSLPWIVSVKLFAVAVMRLDRGVWRYAGLSDVVRTGQAAAVGSLLALATSSMLDLGPALWRVLLTDFLLYLPCTVGMRVGPRLVWERRGARPPARRILVLGAGDAAEMLVRHLKREPAGGYVPVALVDDDRAKWGRKIHGVEVCGPMDQVVHWAQKTNADAVLLGLYNARPDRIDEIVRLARTTGLPVKRLPALDQMLSGRVPIHELRDLPTDQLLTRRRVQGDRARLANLVRRRCVLVTGAAGSIGSELSRQILAEQPSHLVLVDANESALFDLEHQLKAASGSVDVEFVLASVCDETKMDRIFAHSKPELVFHAAAYKHVPVLEHFPEEAVLNNVHGTRVVARLADRHGVENFVLISTDKAVRPTSVMGATKRISELLVAQIDRASQTRFTTLRFGNVLGSNGSVVQLFRKQIVAGGPVTVTHPEIRRFFMTIPEAVELVLFAVALDDEGSVFILEMGEQVRVVEMAENLIRLCGLEPGRDIAVEFTGLRPGEKLYEELWTEVERPLPTAHPEILRAPRPPEMSHELDVAIDLLIERAREVHRPAVIALVRMLVPDYSGEPECGKETDTREPVAPKARGRSSAARVAADARIITPQPVTPVT